MQNFKGSITSKLPGTESSIFAIMSALANETGAINLSQGFPDFPVSEKLIELVHKYMKKGMNQYAPMLGVQSLREVISEKIFNTYGASYHPEKEINITAGATQALYTIISAVVHDGDEVLIFEPAYDSYIPAIRINGGIPIHAQLQAPDYHIDWDIVKKMINKNTKMIIINSPQNPTGSILKKEDLKMLSKLTDKTDIVIISDEVYEHLIYDGIRHESVCLYPELAERSYIVYSFGKTLHATGWKMGYVVAPENLMKEFRKVHQFNVFTCNTPIQYAIAEYLKDKENYIHLKDFYQQKRDFFVAQIKDSRFKVVPCFGTYFQLLDFSNITEEKETDFAIRMTKEYKLASIPLSPFYHNNKDNKMLRFCFAKTEDTMKKAAEILNKI
ncbi:MAG: methionine aminotransferase [Bacteroidales bacterium]